MSEKRKQAVFTRDATGLVKGFSVWDSFGLGFGSIGVATGLPFIFYTLNLTLPGADLTTACLITFPVGVVAFALVYIMLGAMSPRSGFDYVINSRVLSPPIGFGISWLFVITWLLIAAVYADLTTSVYLPSFLLSIGQTQAATVLTATYGRAAFDTVVLLVGTVLTMVSVRTFAKAQTICVIGALVAVVLMFALTGFLASQGFPNVYNSVAGAGAYSKLISDAEAAGYATPTFSWTQSLLAVILILYYVYGYTPMAVAGEMKTVKKSLTAAMLIASALSWLAILGMGILYYSTFGSDFARSLAYLASANPSISPLGSSPTLNNLLAYVYGNTPLIVLLNLCIALNSFILVPQLLLLPIRHIFAWSFDRLAPVRLAEISRFRTPVITAALVFVATELMILLYVFTGLISALLNSALLATPLGIGAGLSALVLPYTKKTWFESAPSFVRMKVANIPILSIIGLVTAVGLGIYTISVVLFPEIGYPVTALNLEFLIIYFVAGIVLYYLACFFRRRQGIDLGLAFGEIPPE